MLTTFRAKGLLPDTHPLGAGVLGRSGTPVASWLMNTCDLLVVVGASFSNHTGIAPYKPVVQIDDDHARIGRFQKVDVGLLGDAALTLDALVAALGDAATAAVDQRGDVVARWALWRAEKARRAGDDRGDTASTRRRSSPRCRATPPRTPLSPSTWATTRTRSGAISNRRVSRC